MTKTLICFITAIILLSAAATAAITGKWTFNNNMTDDSGNGNDAISEGAMQIIDDDIKGSGYSVGDRNFTDAEYYTLPDAAFDVNGVGTFSFWVNCTTNNGIPSETISDYTKGKMLFSRGTAGVEDDIAVIINGTGDFWVRTGKSGVGVTDEIISHGDDIIFDNWTYIVLVKETLSQRALYLNGQLKQNTTTGEYGLMTASETTQIGTFRDAGNGNNMPSGYDNCRIDEIIIDNAVQDPTNISGTYAAMKAPPTPPITAPTVEWNTHPPNNDTIHNTDITFSYNVAAGTGTLDNCTLYTNETTVGSVTAVAGNQSIKYNITSGVHVYGFNVTCTDTDNNQGSSSEKTIYIDTENPVITWTTPANDNTTKLQINISYPFDITITDANLYTINVTVWKKNGDIAANNFSENVNTSTFNYVEGLTFNESGVYYVEVEGTDSHTLTNIPTFKTSKGNDYLQFDNIKLTLLDSPQSTEYAKQTDRYTYAFTTNTKTPTENTYRFKLENTNAQKITYLPNSKYKGHFISGNKWIDFEPYNVKVTAENNYYLISITTSDTKISFSSIGLLNNITEYRQFIVYDDLTTTHSLINGTYYLTTNSSLTDITEMNYTIGKPDGSLLLDNTNATTNTGGYWNTSNYEATQEGTYYWNVSAYVDGVFWGNGTGSFNVNYTAFDANITIDEGCGFEGFAFKAYDDNNFGQTNYTLKTHFIIYETFGSPSFNKTFNVLQENVETVNLCIEGGSGYYNVSAMLEYYGGESNTTYSIRNYYLENALTQPATTTTYNLFLLPTNMSSLIQITLQDKAEEPLEDYLVHIQRYVVENNTYQLIGMAKSDIDGKDLINLEMYNTWYRFVIYDKNRELVYTGTKVRMTSNTLTITINPSTITGLINRFGNIQTTLSYDNQTGVFTFVYADPSGTASNFCFEVYHNTFNNNTRICSTCETAASGTMFCSVGNATGVYIASGYVTISGVKNILATLTADIVSDVSRTIKEKLGNDGIILTILMSGTMAFAFAWSPITALLALFIGVIASVMLGIITISWVAIVMLGIVIGIIVYKIRG